MRFYADLDKAHLRRAAAEELIEHGYDSGSEVIKRLDQTERRRSWRIRCISIFLATPGLLIGAAFAEERIGSLRPTNWIAPGVSCSVVIAFIASLAARMKGRQWLRRGLISPRAYAPSWALLTSLVIIFGVLGYTLEHFFAVPSHNLSARLWNILTWH